MSWSGPVFRYDNIEKHLENCHQTHWAQYQELHSPAEKASFFDDVAVPFRNTMAAHFIPESLGERQITFTFDKAIIEDLIGDMLYSPDDDSDDEADEQPAIDESMDAEALRLLLKERREKAKKSKERAMSIFKPVPVDEADDVAEGDGEQDPPDISHYVVVIAKTKTKLFNIVTRYIACGASFRMVSNLISHDYLVFGNPVMRSCPRQLVATYARIVCASNFQRLAKFLREHWTFSIALDSATHQSTSYLDVRLRLFIASSVQNFHLFALPLLDRHTGAVMFDMITKALDILCPDWKAKLMGCSSDGARNMTGRFQGVVTRIARIVDSSLIRIWCGAHQLDLVIQAVMDDVVKDRFFQVMTNFIRHLIRQQNLIAEMASTCPRIVNRWLSTDKVTTWFVSKRLELQRYCNEKHPASEPPALWWVYLLGMDRFTELTAKAFTKIQGMSILVSQQQAVFDDLIQNYISTVGGVGPLGEGALQALDDTTHVISGLYAVSFFSVSEFLCGLGSWVENVITAADNDEKKHLLYDIGSAFVQACSKVSSISVERDQNNSEILANSSLSQMMPVLPHQLVKVTPANFLRKARLHVARLEHFFDPEYIDVIGREHRELLQAFRGETVVRDVLSSLDDDASSDFEKGWGNLGVRFPNLHEFCGGIATVFPGTSTVESDFSILRWEKSNFRKSLSDFGLEAIIQAKQNMRLDALEAHILAQ
jgi:hypothetical protein